MEVTTDLWSLNLFAKLMVLHRQILFSQAITAIAEAILTGLSAEQLPSLYRVARRYLKLVTSFNLWPFMIISARTNIWYDPIYTGVSADMWSYTGTPDIIYRRSTDYETAEANLYRFDHNIPARPSIWWLVEKWNQVVTLQDNMEMPTENAYIYHTKTYLEQKTYTSACSFRRQLISVYYQYLQSSFTEAAVYSTNVQTTSTNFQCLSPVFTIIAHKCSAWTIRKLVANIQIES